MSANRNLRVGVAGLLLAGVGTILAPYMTSYVSTSAVVNAPLVTIRSPFDGIIAAASPEVARAVDAGARLARVQGERQDQGTLAELQGRDQASAALLAAMEREGATLSALSGDLDARDTAGRAQALASNAAWQKEILAGMRAARARGREIALRVERSRALVESGALPAAMLERERAEEETASAELQRLEARMEDARVEHDGLSRAVIRGRSGSDGDYARQRRDEIAMRLATLATDAARLVAERRGLAREIAFAQARVAAHERFEPMAGTSGVIWRASPSAGTEVLAGDEIVKLVDCERRFIEVAVSERHFESIAPGTRAEVRLRGGATPFEARVDAVKGSGAKLDHPDLAAEPPEVPSGQLRVMIRLAPVTGAAAQEASAFCDVGRTAEVRFDRSLSSDFRGLRHLGERIGEAIAALTGRDTALAGLLP